VPNLCTPKEKDLRKKQKQEKRSTIHTQILIIHIAVQLVLLVVNNLFSHITDYAICIIEITI